MKLATPTTFLTLLSMTLAQTCITGGVDGICQGGPELIYSCTDNHKCTKNGNSCVPVDAYWASANCS
ncbi:hypothetical protein EJ03DRAFT_53888 [Teratosphaeria nubilosa]|uniref:Extracellular membrane protein CFEM domain-containing protein n=1 Tax=Teratosphaeria nubilosa TaxID=161662 RepID=A0A6G1KT49_9PEZI|nr:hypothetical protein EJ03DRAFT_53888 [Teratosphaeria nubilosa]